MKLIDAVAVVNDFEPADHEAGETGSLFILHSLTDGVADPRLLYHLVGVADELFELLSLRQTPIIYLRNIQTPVPSFPLLELYRGLEYR